MPTTFKATRPTKYRGILHPVGATFDVDDKDLRVAREVFRAEEFKPAQPVRKVSETKAPDPRPVEAVEPIAEAAPEPTPAPAVAALSTDDLPPTSLGKYRNRALKSED
jgi:hypothetical protein